MKHFMVSVLSKGNKSMLREQYVSCCLGESALYFSINMNLTNHLTFKTPQEGCNAYFLIKILRQIMLIFFYISTCIGVL